MQRNNYFFEYSVDYWPNAALNYQSAGSSFSKEYTLFNSTSPIQAVKDSIIYLEHKKIEFPEASFLYGIVSKVSIVSVMTDVKEPFSKIKIFGDTLGGEYIDKARVWVEAMEQ